MKKASILTSEIVTHSSHINLQINSLFISWIKTQKEFVHYFNPSLSFSYITLLYLKTVVIDTTPSPAIDGTECTKTVATSPTKRNPTSGKLPSKKTQAKPKETIPKISSSSECETEEDDDAFELRFKRALNLRLAKTQETNVSSYKSKQFTLREAQMQL